MQPVTSAADNGGRYLLDEEAISLAEASRMLPTDSGFPCHLSTLTRWILAGLQRPDGTRLKLEAMMFAGHWVTSREAVRRFVEGRRELVQASIGKPV